MAHRGSPPLALRAGLLSLLGIFLAHAWLYRFLCDDAFISFRYARNLAEGAGLVFNPGEAPVEGYTNLLWVLLLAAGARVGLAPEQLAPALSLGASAGLFGLVAAWAIRERRPRDPWILVLLAPLLLAATRSVAVWSTGGLETRLFELLVVAGALRLLAERRVVAAGGSPRALAAPLFAAATWTRPEGMLLAGCAAGALLLARGPRSRRWLVASAALYALPVAAQLGFRLLYYGDLLPNTFYAKVGGRLPLDVGLGYAELFALEYGIPLWLPLLAAALRFHAVQGTRFTPLLFAALVVPHALYVVAVGGDHFEYRPFDLYFPFAFLLLHDGARHLARRPRAAPLLGAYLALLLVALVELPARSHLEFPARYQPGFPGSRADARPPAFLAPKRGWLSALPGVRALAGRHRDLLLRTTRHFAALRAEEHRLFLASVLPEARLLRRLVVEGRLPADTRLALDSVGAVPYHSRLPTLDRLGLTDRAVAHSEAVGPALLGHSKHASPHYARAAGVDLWAIHPVHFLWLPGDPGLRVHLAPFHEEGIPAWYADVGRGLYLVAYLPQGIEHARRRFPRLEFRSVHDPAYHEDLAPRRG